VCKDPNCDHHDDSVLYFHQACHLGGPIEASYDKLDHTVTISCLVCHKEIVKIQVAEEPVNNYIVPEPARLVNKEKAMKLSITDERITEIVKVMQKWVTSTIGLKFPVKRTCENVDISDWPDETGKSKDLGVWVKLITSGRNSVKNPLPEFWFGISAGVEKVAGVYEKLLDEYVLDNFSVLYAPWDKDKKRWGLDGDYAYLQLEPGTAKISSMSFGNTYDLD
jgi:hypothetical protein